MGSATVDSAGEAEATITERTDTERTSPPWPTIAKRAFFLVAAGVALYLLSPRIIDVLASAPRLPRS